MTPDQARRIALAALLGVASCLPCYAQPLDQPHPLRAERGLGQPPSPAPDDDAGRRAQAIREAKACIAFSQKSIDAENEIGRTVGVVNKAALYQAGRNLIICRQNLARLHAEAAARKP